MELQKFGLNVSFCSLTYARHVYVGTGETVL